MTFQQELTSWLSPTSLDVSATPQIGSKAPSSEDLKFPVENGKPTIVSFLRHCGCPFAEKTFRSLKEIAKEHPDINIIAVSHSDRESTDKWVSALDGPGDVKVITNPTRTLYAHWGLGVSSFWHVLNPWSLSNVFKLGREEGIWNRPTESGNRWQTAGSWAVDGQGNVVWGKASETADEEMDWVEAVGKVSGKV